MWKLEDPVRTEEGAEGSRRSDDAALNFKGQIQMEMLCAGEQVRVRENYSKTRF